MGWCFHGYWPGMTPLADVISLPALPFKTGEKGSEVLWNLYEKFPEIKKQYARQKHIQHPYYCGNCEKIPLIHYKNKSKVRNMSDCKCSAVKD